MSTQQNYLDTDVLNSLSQFLDQDKLYQLLERYIKDSNQLIEQLEMALEDHNTSEARRMVHSLKSTSANIGAHPLSQFSKQLEELACEDNLSAIQTDLDELKQLFTQTVQHIRELDIIKSRQAG